MLPSPMLAGLLGSQMDPSVLNNPALLRLLSGAPSPAPMFGAPIGPTQQPINVPLGATQAPPDVPMQVPPSIPAPPPSGWQNLLAGLFPDQTGGLSGLLAPDAVSQARNSALLDFGTSLLGSAGPHFRYQAPSLGQAVAQGIQAGRAGFQQGIQQAVQGQLTIPQIQMQMQEIAARQRLNAMAPSLTGMTRADLVQHLPGIAAAYLQAGQPQSAQALAEIARTLGVGTPFQAVQAGDSVWRFNPMTGQAEPMIQRGMDPDTLGIKKAQLADAQLSLKVRQEQYDETQDRMAGQQFRAANQKLYDTAQTIAMARASLAQLSAKNPAALSSAILAMVNVADPKAQLRSQLVNYMSTVDKSWRGNFDQVIQRIQSGTMPAAQLQEMKNLVEQHAQTYERLYDQRRSEAIKNRPGSALWIPSTDAVFNTPNIGPNDTLGPSGTPGRSSVLWQY